jgi:hypothetical protein
MALAACTQAALPPGSPAPLVAATRPVFATQLAGPQTVLAPMPTAVVILKPGDLNRNRAFCTTITSLLPTAQQALAAAAIAPNLIFTRWLVQLPDEPPERAADCDFLAGTYDYARAARLVGALHLTDGSLSGPGPFLLMIVPDSTCLHVIGLDGSSYADTNFPQFVNTWGSALKQTELLVTRKPDQPGLVRSIFDLVSAIVRTAAGVTGGIIRGAVSNL